MKETKAQDAPFDDESIETSAAEWRAKAARRDRLLVRMNHRIRTAVNVILGLTDVMRESELSPSICNSMNVVRTSAESLLKESAEIIDLTRAEVGNLQLSSTSFSLHDTLQQAMDLMSILASCKRVTLRFQISRKAPLIVVGDPVRLNQIVITLVRAAIQRLDQGEISVTVEHDVSSTDGVRIKLRIADNGRRIPPGALAGMLDDELEPDGSMLAGPEVSLMLARHLARMMGGDLWAEAEPPIGVVFHFNVNLRLAPLGSFQLPRKSGVEARNGRRPLKILVADDSSDTLLLIRAFLKDVPWEVESADNGRVASEMAISKPYDLILMDLDMPEMDGYAATRQIRSSECLKQEAAVPIVALTAHNEAEAASKSIAAGCTAHVTKPIRRAALIDTIQRYASDTRRDLVLR
jgi:CheY-like chemotaxis protein